MKSRRGVRGVVRPIEITSPGPKSLKINYKPSGEVVYETIIFETVEEMEALIRKLQQMSKYLRETT